jgi:hypothetical protein
MRMLNFIGPESPCREFGGDIIRKLLDGLAIFLLPFLPSITAFVLVAFSPLGDSVNLSSSS